MARKTSVPIGVPQSFNQDSESWTTTIQAEKPVKQHMSAARAPLPASIRLDRRLSQARSNTAAASATNIKTTRRNSAFTSQVSDNPPQVAPVALSLPNLHVPILVSADSEAYQEEQKKLAAFKNMLGGFVDSQKDLETGIYTSIWASDQDKQMPTSATLKSESAKDGSLVPAIKTLSAGNAEENQPAATAQDAFQMMKETIDRISKQDQYQLCYRGTKSSTARLRSIHARQAQSPVITLSKPSPQVKMSSMSHSTSASASSRRTTGVTSTHVRSSSTETLNSKALQHESRPTTHNPGTFSMPRSPKSRSPSYSPSDVALLNGEHDKVRNTLAAKSRYLLLSGLSFAGEMLIPHDLQPPQT